MFAKVSDLLSNIPAQTWKAQPGPMSVCLMSLKLVAGPSCKTTKGKHYDGKLGCTCGQHKPGLQEVSLQKQSHPTSRQLLPVLVQPTFCTLNSQEVQYFDRFRNQIVYQVGIDERFDDFWFRTVFRESVSSKGVLGMILGLGALGHALENAPRDIPLYKAGLSTYPTSHHYDEAVKYYVRSLVMLRQQISSQLEASSRSLLISTILFSVFEVLQGNGAASDKHLASGVSILKNTVIRSAGPERRSLIAAYRARLGLD